MIMPAISSGRPNLVVEARSVDLDDVHVVAGAPQQPRRTGGADSMSDLRYTANTGLEHLHARYTGTINADTTRHEWATHQHRDTAATIIGQPSLAAYLALADGVSRARLRFELAEKMLQPCGPPPADEPNRIA